MVSMRESTGEFRLQKNETKTEEASCQPEDVNITYVRMQSRMRVAGTHAHRQESYANHLMLISTACENEGKAATVPGVDATQIQAPTQCNPNLVRAGRNSNSSSHQQTNGPKQDW
jgi:hypothetical protein